MCRSEMKVTSKGAEMGLDLLGISDNYLDRHGPEGLTYPSEDLIRIFKGSYPSHNFSSDNYANSTVCELSVGDGRNVRFLDTLGFSKVFGTEITEEMADVATKKLRQVGVNMEILVASNLHTPFDEAELDYLISWNSCYYVESVGDFAEHVIEFGRILKSGGKLVLSIPMESH